MYKPLKAVGVFLLLSISVKAQEFGGNPPSVKWYQINTPQTRVIFPAGMDSTAQQVAWIINKMSRRIQPTIGFKQKQVSVLLQNQTTISNAFVQLAPFRSEFYLTAEQNSFDIGSINWPWQLAIHEYRHVQQYNNFNVGLSHGLRVLFGEGGQALGNELAIPNWFFEGDAVFNETLVSDQGRGRIPYFFDGYRGLWAAGKNYSYMKLRNGSYIDYVPNHYPLGYMLVSYGRQQYGAQLWRDVTHNAAAYKSLFNPFQNAFSHTTHTTFNRFSNEALQYFKQQFNDASTAPEQQKQHFTADYEYPAFVDGQTLIYMRSGYKKRPVFVLKTGDAERIVSVRDVSQDNYFAYCNGQVVYAAYRPDTRWGYRDYSELRLLDIHTGKQRTLTTRSKYFAPDFSADGKIIVTVEQAPNGKCQVHLLNAANGRLVAKVPNPENVFVTYPKFYKPDELVAAVRTANGQMYLALINIGTGKLTPLANFGYAPAAFLKLEGEIVYFTAAKGNNDVLFAYNIAQRKLYQLQDSELKGAVGNYQPAVNNGKLAWVSFTANGYRIHQTNTSNLAWTAVAAETGPGLSNFGLTVLEADSATNMLAEVKATQLPISKYHKGYNLFNFHSIIPALNDPNYTVSLEGENVLGTFQSDLSFNYNRDEGYKELSFGGVYGALFPYLRGSVDYTFDRRGYYSKTNSDVYWNEMQARIGVGIPLNFSNRRHITGLSFGTDVVYNNTSFQQSYRSLFQDRSYAYFNNYISFSNHIAAARQNIYPHWGQSISINYKYAFTNINASQVLTSGTIYLPGLASNHSLVIGGAFQQNARSGIIRFSNGLSYSRGYTAENLYQLERVGVNYHFPIVYPDKGVANTVYLSRLRGNVFFDYTHAHDYYNTGQPFNKNFRSVGAELYFDSSWFNQLPITFGLRFSHLLDEDYFGGSGQNRVELIVPVTFF